MDLFVSSCLVISAEIGAMSRSKLRERLAQPMDISEVLEGVGPYSRMPRQAMQVATKLMMQERLVPSRMDSRGGESWVSTGETMQQAKRGIPVGCPAPALVA